MQKKLLVLVMSLILSTTSVMASCGCVGDCQCGKIKCNCNQNKFSDYPKQYLLYKKYIMSLQSEHETVYNALNLTDEQIKKRKDLMQSNAQFYEQNFDKLLRESYKVRALSSANAPTSEINKQKRIVKNIKNDIEDTVKKENKEFRKCLNRNQRAKYSMIKKLERRDFKKSLHPKDYYKSNPQMIPFGNPKPVCN